MRMQDLKDGGRVEGIGQTHLLTDDLGEGIGGSKAGLAHFVVGAYVFVVFGQGLQLRTLDLRVGIFPDRQVLGDTRTVRRVLQRASHQQAEDREGHARQLEELDRARGVA